MAIPKTVLIAENDANDVFLLRRAFAKAKVSAALHFVQDGQEAIDYLKGEAGFSDRVAHPLPDLVLLDLKMPRIGGSTVLEWIRQQTNLRSLPVIVLSSSNLQADIDRAYELGANSYIVKPHGHRELCEMAAVVNRRWLEPDSDAAPGEEPQRSKAQSEIRWVCWAASLKSLWLRNVTGCALASGTSGFSQPTR